MDSLTSRHIRWTLILLTAVIITGCENSNRLGDGHDFGDNDQNVYLALGDSITYGYGLSSQATYSVKLSAMIGKTVINAGIGGETSFGGTTKVNSLNAQIREMAAEENVPVVDLAVAFNWNSDYMLSDGLHPNAEGAELIALTFGDVLN